MPAPLTVLHASDVARCASWSNLLVLCWKRAPSAAELAALAPVIAHHGAARRCAFLVLTSSDLPPPAGDVRPAMAKAIKSIERSLEAVAIVVGGAGVRAAAVRGVLLGLRVVVAPPYPMAVYAHLDEALGFLLPSLVAPAGEGIDVAGLAAEIALL